MLLNQQHRDNLWSQPIAQEKGGSCQSTIRLTEGNAIMVLQQNRQTKSLQVSNSWLPGLMRTSKSVLWPASTCTPLALSLKQLMQPRRNTIFPYNNLRPPTILSQKLHLTDFLNVMIDAHCSKVKCYLGSFAETAGQSEILSLPLHHGLFLQWEHVLKVEFTLI